MFLFSLKWVRIQHNVRVITFQYQQCCQHLKLKLGQWLSSIRWGPLFFCYDGDDGMVWAQLPGSGCWWLERVAASVTVLMDTRNSGIHLWEAAGILNLWTVLSRHPTAHWHAHVLRDVPHYPLYSHGTVAVNEGTDEGANQEYWKEKHHVCAGIVVTFSGSDGDVVEQVAHQRHVTQGKYQDVVPNGGYEVFVFDHLHAHRSHKGVLPLYWPVRPVEQRLRHATTKEAERPDEADEDDVGSAVELEQIAGKLVGVPAHLGQEAHNKAHVPQHHGSDDHIVLVHVVDEAQGSGKAQVGIVC